MLSYRNELKLKVHLKNGSTRGPDLDPESMKETPLDVAIAKLALDVLKGQVLITFFYAYRCTPTWDDIQIHFLKHHGKELDQETVKKYARQAMTRIVDSARELKEAIS